MRNHDAFWRSGGSRGVDDVGGVLRFEGEGRCGGGLRRDRGPVGVEAHDAGAMRGQPLDERGLGQQQRRARIFEHEAEALGRVVRVERQIGAAGLEDAEQRDDHLQRALDAQPHHDLGPDAERAQVMRQLIGARIELAHR